MDIVVKICEPNHNLYDLAKSFKPDIIFNALHGQYGEDGYVQTILENIKIPYTTLEYLHLQKQWIRNFKKYLLKIKY